MFSKAKHWIGIGKPKNQHSLENLKYLYGILNKNQIVTENNKDLLIETLRSISEILIWGDQNDSSVFDFFLEKQMITFFLHYMKQKHGRFICVQLLQTLNILFENIRHETSLYFLLSNNHINNIILNKFDFSDEEVMAYYISFLKTLSLKLNKHSIHFFFNERGSEFPLYVEALKFFDHPESMVRIAVRTLTLNVFGVPVASMHKFIRDRTAVYYFSNLVWLLRNHVLDLDLCVANTVDLTKKSQLTGLIDEYIDHLNYLQDIFMINNEGLSHLLAQQLVRRLLVPVFLSSILKKDRFLVKDRKPYIQPCVALFLMSHFFLVITHAPLINEICEFIFNLNDEKVLDQLCFQKERLDSISTEKDYLSEPKSLVNCLTQVSGILKSGKRNRSTRSRSMSHLPTTSLQSTRANHSDTTHNTASNNDETGTSSLSHGAGGGSGEIDAAPMKHQRSESSRNDENQKDEFHVTASEKLIEPLGDEAEAQKLINESHLTSNKTDDEKYSSQIGTSTSNSASESKLSTPTYGIIFESILQCMNTQDYNELNSLLALSFIYTLINNTGFSDRYRDNIQVRLSKTSKESIQSSYNENLIGKLIGVLSKAVEIDFKVRLSTLDLTIRLIKNLVIVNEKSYINDFHLACVEQAREQSAFLLRRQFKTEEMFLDMFEHEYQIMRTSCASPNLEYLMRDSAVLLPPTSTPLSGIEFTRRLPCGDTEKLKQTIRVFFYLRDLCIRLANDLEIQLPLTKQEHLVKENDALDLNSSDLIACTVNLKDKKDRRFLVIDPIQFILVEPEVKRLGWGVVKFSDLIQDVDVTPDKEDSRSLNISIKKSSSSLNDKPQIVLNSVFTFDDHIRCMAAKQHLMRARDRARRLKLEKIAQMLDISSNQTPVTTKHFATQSPSNSNVIGYNLVAGLNMLGSINHPGRASMISQTWSQITDQSKSITTSPMITLTSSPMVRSSPSQQKTSNTLGNQHRQYLFSSPSLGVIGSAQQSHQSLSRHYSLSPNETTSFDVSASLSSGKDDTSHEEKKTNREAFHDENVEKKRASLSSNSTGEKPNIVKTLMTNTDQSISLISTNFNEAETQLTSKIQILPPADISSNNNHSSSSSSSFNYLKDKSSNANDELNIF